MHPSLTRPSLPPLVSSGAWCCEWRRRCCCSGRIGIGDACHWRFPAFCVLLFVPLLFSSPNRPPLRHTFQAAAFAFFVFSSRTEVACHPSRQDRRKSRIYYSRRSCAASTRTWLLNRTAPAVTSPASFWPSRPIFFPTHPRLAAFLQQSTDCCTSFLLCPGAGSRTTIPQFRPPEAVGMATPPGKLRNLLYPNHNRRRPLPHQRAYPQHLPHTSNPSIREGKALCAQSPV